MVRVYGTWHDSRTGLRHYASGVPDRDVWDTNLFCGGYIVAKPTEPCALVTCVRCLWKRLQSRDPLDLLRGRRADLVIVDEVQEFDLVSATQPRP